MYIYTHTHIHIHILYRRRPALTVLHVISLSHALSLARLLSLSLSLSLARSLTRSYTIALAQQKKQKKIPSFIGTLGSQEPVSGSQTHTSERWG